MTGDLSSLLIVSKSGLRNSCHSVTIANASAPFNASVELAGHPRLLRIAFEQLLDNAFKFTGQREGALIEVHAEVLGDRISIRVRDNGVGFHTDFARKLFGAFQRLHSVEEFEGHGIGLAMVERVVRMHGGNAWAEGVPNAGATIHLDFPRSGVPQ